MVSVAAGKGSSSTPRSRLFIAIAILTVIFATVLFVEQNETLPSNSQSLLTGMGDSRDGSIVVSSDMVRSDDVLPPISACDAENQQRRLPLMALDMVRDEVGTYYNKTFAMQNKKLDFYDIGRRLLNRAMSLNQTLLTYQIGGMDGVTNDPMHDMFLNKKGPKLPTRHWMPVVVEGNSVNYETLNQNYRQFSQQHGMQCLSIAHWAIAYKSEDKGSGTCKFCRFNVSENALPICKRQPQWLQKQVGTINCELSKRVMGEKFDPCVVQEKVDCGSTLDLFRRKVGLVEAASRIAILQIDTEGYEGVLLPRLMAELSEHQYGWPPVIHFESNILRRWKRRDNNRELDRIYALLKSKGYYIIEGHQDDLAIQMRNQS